MDSYVVIGNPVSHSKSPEIHSLFAKQTGQQLDYSALFAELDKFEETAAHFFSAGGKGANVTLPFKEEAFRLADDLSAEAEFAGAVNTLSVDNTGGLRGHNTDGIGLVTDICSNHGGSLANKNVLVLGAGGAARGILQPLLKQGPAVLTIANRTASKAEALAEIVQSAGNPDMQTEVAGSGYIGLGGRKYDWIINATSASLQGEVPPISTFLLAEETWCYDLMYAKKPTPFCQWAKEAGAKKSIDGLGMLVEQAAESFLTWRGVRPETSEVIKLLRAG